jgi:hypothetical protein
VKILFKIISFSAFLFILTNLSYCKKDKFITDAGAKIQLSQDSVLFDTVFTSIGSATRNIRVRNKNSQKIKISSIQLLGGISSAFKLNVDGTPGVSFTDIEIAAHDSMYIFIQVNVNPTNINSPLIISDAIIFNVNGNEQKLNLEAWGQDAWYHYPTDAIKFKDGSFLAYSLISKDTLVDTIWKKDKPHVVYGYLVVDEKQKLKIEAGVQIYMNYKAGLWVYQGGQLQVQGEKGNEVIFQGARREKDFADEPGQWDRIWINEGSLNNEINYAIIKNGYIGVQAELLGQEFYAPKHLKITNTKIQNMSKWGLYGLAFNIYGGNNVISNCQENSVNLILGGSYTFLNCTFSNFWSKDKARDKATISINNYSDSFIFPLDSAYFGNCIVDGKLSNEVNVDIKAGLNGTLNIAPSYKFSNCWLKTTNDISNPSLYLNCKKDNTSLKYKDIDKYDFEPKADETRIQGFSGASAVSDAQKFPLDINKVSRNAAISNNSITAGAYEIP